jgi:hypothetical protein
MIGYRRAIAVLLVVAVAGSSGACTSMRLVPPAAAPGAAVFGKVKSGDTVAVLLTDGRRDIFQVASIDGDTIVSTAGPRYVRSDVVELKRRSISGIKTGFLAAGIGVGAFFALAAALFLAYF